MIHGLVVIPVRRNPSYHVLNPKESSFPVRIHTRMASLLVASRRKPRQNGHPIVQSQWQFLLKRWTWNREIHRPQLRERKFQPLIIWRMLYLEDSCGVYGREGERGRKYCSPKEGSVGEREFLGASDFASVSWCKEALASNSAQIARSSGVEDQSSDSSKDRIDEIMRIFSSVAENDCASVFQRRLDSQVNTNILRLVSLWCPFFIFNPSTGFVLYSLAEKRKIQENDPSAHGLRHHKI